MSRSVMFVLGFVVLGLCLSTANAAEQGDKAKGKRRDGKAGGDRKADILKRFDKNGDGKLDEQEREVAKKAMQQRRQQGGGGGGEFFARMIERMDTNKDGQLSAQEIAAGRKAMQERRKNFDGKKKGSKKRDGDKKGRGKGPGQGRGDFMSHLLEKFDKNKDGGLDKMELAAAKTAMKNRQRSGGKGRPGGKKKGADGKGKKRPEKKQGNN